MFFGRPFNGSWKPTWPEKPPKRWPGRMPLCSCFRAWKGLGGVLRPLGAQELILIDFCWYFIDFARFLMDFWMIFQWFLIDFWCKGINLEWESIKSWFKKCVKFGQHLDLISNGFWSPAWVQDIKLSKVINVLLFWYFVCCPSVRYLVCCSFVKTLCQTPRQWTHVGQFGVGGEGAIGFLYDEHLPSKNCINGRFDEERRCTLCRAAGSGRLYQQQVACPARL